MSKEFRISFSMQTALFSRKTSDSIKFGLLLVIKLAIFYYAVFYKPLQVTPGNLIQRFGEREYSLPFIHSPKSRDLSGRPPRSKCTSWKMGKLWITLITGCCVCHETVMKASNGALF